MVGDCNEYESCGLRNDDDDKMPAVSHYMRVECNMIVNLSAVSDILVKTDAEVREEASLGKLQRINITFRCCDLLPRKKDKLESLITLRQRKNTSLSRN